MTPKEIEAFCKTLAPELNAVPLHIVFASWMSEALADAREYLATTTPWLDVSLGCHRFRGRGPCILFNDKAIRQEAAKYAQDSGLDLLAAIERHFVLIAVHELGHVLDRDALFDPDESNFMSLANMARNLATPARQIATMLDAKPWAGHGSQWIRMTLHLNHRAACAGHHIPVSAPIDHQRFQLSHPERYRVSLADEPARLESWPLSMVKLKPPPAAFAETWESDLAWHAARAAEAETVAQAETAAA